MLVRSLLTKNIKRLARDVFDTFATNTGVAGDVTDADCWTHNSSTHGPLFATSDSRV